MEADVKDDERGMAIIFPAQIAQIKTMADGGFRISLDLPETAIEEVSKLIRIKQAGALLELAAVAFNQSDNGWNPT